MLVLLTTEMDMYGVSSSDFSGVTTRKLYLIENDRLCSSKRRWGFKKEAVAAIVIGFVVVVGVVGVVVEDGGGGSGGGGD
ncbi:hypothetical protein QVD17_09820 [Tagetes erecta]|uniref:Transmembrane protein n=1 Tax=Tagetes erecta TaxID=13708 RepID=A0AAD8P5N0_TARER|nr:hypothetical protein QVD17_09820 [Tagetes erecta]